MKRMMFALVAATLVAGTSGCCGFNPFWWPRHCNPWHGACGGCGDYDCGGGCGCGCGDHPGPGYDGAYGPGPTFVDGPGPVAAAGGCASGQCGLAAQGFQGGPPTAQVTYPYYTTRGPRDFLARQPRSPGL